MTTFATSSNQTKNMPMNLMKHRIDLQLLTTDHDRFLGDCGVTIQIINTKSVHHSFIECPSFSPRSSSRAGPFLKASCWWEMFFDYCNMKNLSLVIAKIDQEKAFNIVDRPFLVKVLTKMKYLGLDLLTMPKQCIKTSRVEFPALVIYQNL